MRTSSKTAAAATALSIGSLFASLSAHACGVSDLRKGPADLTAAYQAFNAVNALRPAAAAALSVAGASSDGSMRSSSRHSIVGLWKYTWTAQGNANIPDGAPIGFGLEIFHSDGTEIGNAGDRAPMTADVCFGVYESGNDHGTMVYRVNHLAESWNDTGTAFVGPADIHMQLALDPFGDTYSGTLTIDQYASDGTTSLAHVTGTVSATRVTASQ